MVPWETGYLVRYKIKITHKLCYKAGKGYIQQVGGGGIKYIHRLRYKCQKKVIGDCSKC